MKKPRNSSNNDGNPSINSDEPASLPWGFGNSTNPGGTEVNTKADVTYPRKNCETRIEGDLLFKEITASLQVLCEYQQTTKLLTWKPGGETIPFWVGENCLGRLKQTALKLDADRVLVIADENVARIYGEMLIDALGSEFVPTLLRLPATENAKTLEEVSRLAEEAMIAGVTRRSVLIGFGGGMTGNVAGMVASLLFRGIRLMHAPTTLLAMHDSVTSLKQAVNSARCKNQLGLYKRPEAIVCDVTFLRTLDQRQIFAGVVELVKNALLLGGPYYDRLRHALEQRETGSQLLTSLIDLVQLGVSAKEPFISRDPHERGPALIFEYGHTVGHAIEACSMGRLNHGESVAWGLKCAADVAQAAGVMSKEGRQQHDEIMALLGELPNPSCGLSLDDVLACIIRDNKRGYLRCLSGNLQMVLLNRPGAPRHDPTGLPLTEVHLDIVQEVVSALPFVENVGHQPLFDFPVRLS